MTGGRGPVPIQVTATLETAEAMVEALTDGLRAMVEGGTFEERPDHFANLARGHADLAHRVRIAKEQA